MERVFKINIKSFWISTAIIMLFLSIISGAPSWFGLIDDAIPLIFGIIWCIHLVSKKRIGKERNLFILLLSICVIGLASNMVSGLARIIPIILDLYSFLKMFFVYLGIHALLDGKQCLTVRVVNTVSKFSKCFLITSFIFGLLNVVGVVRMYDNMRFGITNYHFIFGNASQFGVLVGVAFAFIIYSKPRCIHFYEFIAIATLVLTMKGMALIIAAVYVAMLLIVNKRIKLWQMILVGAVLAFVLRYQIYTYLLDETAPRAILIRYGAVTANTYFPFGGGFATWASDAAGKFYSPLYSRYGLNTRNAFIYDYVGGTALDDAYLGMAIGQFGWGGTIILGVVFWMIGEKLFKTRTSFDRSKYISIALFACFCGMAVMAGSIKGVPGQLMLLAIQIFCLMNSEELGRTN